jgi:hypothetical protein
LEKPLIATVPRAVHAPTQKMGVVLCNNRLKANVLDGNLTDYLFIFESTNG